MTIANQDGLKDPIPNSFEPNGLKARYSSVDLLTLYHKMLHTQGKKKATVESYVRDAKNFLDFIASYKISHDQVVPETLLYFQEHLIHQKSEKVNSIRRSVVGVRQFYRFLAHQKLVSISPFEEMPIPIRDERLRKGISEETFLQLLQAASQGSPKIKALRDLAILYLLGVEGLKATELIDLTWSDFMSQSCSQTGSITTGKPQDHQSLSTLRIANSTDRHASRERNRVIVLSAETTQSLDAYRQSFLDRKLLEVSTKSKDIVAKKNMFCAFKGKDAALTLPHLTRHGLKFALYEIGACTGIDKLNSETLRHFAVRSMIKNGRSTEQIMAHLGLRRPGNISKHLGLTSIQTADLHIHEL